MAGNGNGHRPAPVRIQVGCAAVAIECIPDGASMIVEIQAGTTIFECNIDRVELAGLARYLLERAEAPI